MKEMKCEICGWTGSYEDLADDGPGHEYVCPHCGEDLIKND
jgi:predicted RNA-binding Zn-ribbon protein involved in translation (DUF1610 family)